MRERECERETAFCVFVTMSDIERVSVRERERKKEKKNKATRQMKFSHLI